MAKGSYSRAFEIVFLLSEVILIIVYLLVTEYGETVHPAAISPQGEAGEAIAKDMVTTYYPVFQDVHVMIFIGFGFLMVFLKTHSWTSVGFNFLIAAYALQLTIPVLSFFHQLLDTETPDWHKVQIELPNLIMGDFGAAAVLITFGAILGKCSLMQLWILATWEIVFYSLNEAICAG